MAQKKASDEFEIQYQNAQAQADPVTVARAKMVERNREAKERAESDREEHLMNIQIAAETKSGELTTLLSSVSPDLAVRIRLEAAIMVYASAGNLFGAQKQLQLDERALELAKYAINGEA